MATVALSNEDQRKILEKIAPWGASLWYVKNLDDSQDYDDRFDDRLTIDTENPDKAWLANAVSSDAGDGRQAIVLDIDMEAALVPSSTKGHYTLYINKVLTKSSWEKLITVLAEVGVIEMRYASSSLDRGRSFARLPWVAKKGIVPSARALADLLRSDEPSRDHSYQDRFRTELADLLKYYGRSSMSRIHPRLLAVYLDRLITLMTDFVYEKQQLDHSPVGENK